MRSSAWNRCGRSPVLRRRMPRRRPQDRPLPRYCRARKPFGGGGGRHVALGEESMPERKHALQPREERGAIFQPRALGVDERRNLFQAQPPNKAKASQLRRQPGLSRHTQRIQGLATKGGDLRSAHLPSRLPVPHTRPGVSMWLCGLIAGTTSQARHRRHYECTGQYLTRPRSAVPSRSLLTLPSYAAKTPGNFRNLSELPERAHAEIQQVA